MAVIRSGRDVKRTGDGFIVQEGGSYLLAQNGKTLVVFTIQYRPLLDSPPKRCQAGICRSGDENAAYEALDLDTIRYYNAVVVYDP